MKKYFKLFLAENIVLIILLICIAALRSGAAFVNLYAFTYLINGNIRVFAHLMGASIGIWVLVFIFTRIEEVQQTKTIQKMNTAIRKDIAERIRRCPYSEFHTNGSGAYVSRMTNDIKTIEDSGFKNVYALVKSLTLAAFSIAALAFIHYGLLLLSLLLAVLLTQFPKLFQKKLNEASLALTHENETFVAQIKDVLDGFDVFFSFNARAQLIGRTQTASEQLMESNVRCTRLTQNAGIFIGLMSVCSQLGIVIATGVLGALQIIPIGAITATGNFSSYIFNALAEFSGKMLAIKSTEPIFEKILSGPEQPEIQALPDAAPRAQFRSAITLDHVSFSYGDTRVLNNLTMTFEIGKKYGIIGESGSGKTTLFKLLSGMIEGYDGSIKIDGAELNTLDMQTVRDRLIYIDQKVYLFNDTIKRNICLDSEFSTEALDKAIENTALKDVIAHLPQGLESPVGEGGRNFSGGQCQRIALARALVHDRRILLIDEGTSALDEKNAREIETALVNNSDLTVIMVNHHFSEEIRSKLDAVYTLR